MLIGGATQSTTSSATTGSSNSSANASAQNEDAAQFTPSTAEEARAELVSLRAQLETLNEDKGVIRDRFRGRTTRTLDAVVDRLDDTLDEVFGDAPLTAAEKRVLDSAKQKFSDSIDSLREEFLSAGRIDVLKLDTAIKRAFGEYKEDLSRFLNPAGTQASADDKPLQLSFSSGDLSNGTEGSATERRLTRFLDSFDTIFDDEIGDARQNLDSAARNADTSEQDTQIEGVQGLISRYQSIERQARELDEVA